MTPVPRGVTPPPKPNSLLVEEAVVDITKSNICMITIEKRIMGPAFGKI